jgi:hypothetical protein
MREGGAGMNVIVVTSKRGDIHKYMSIARLAIAYGEWSDETHIIMSELLEVLFEKNIINGDDLIRMLNMYDAKSIEKEVQG